MIDTQLSGQWIGSFEGTNAGQAVCDLDQEEGIVRGSISAFDADSRLPSLLIPISLIDGHSEHHIEVTDLRFLHPTEPMVLHRAQILSEHPELALPIRLQLHLKFEGRLLTAEWTSDIGTKGSAQLVRSDPERRSDSESRSDIRTWKQFVDYALDLRARKYIFRGQDCSKKLRTSFHRTRRKDLVRYLDSDLQIAHHTLTAQTKHYFNLLDPLQNAAFLNVLQHHGFPTPLLDWTYSPFVAAFFAYRFRRERAPEDDHVRLFVFDHEGWMAEQPQIQSIAYARPHLSVLEALSLENIRSIPQQSVSTVTNIDDIESFIRVAQRNSPRIYLETIDLPFIERREVMEQLSLMGITAASLFPGLDGACEELRGRYFFPIR